MRVKGSTVTTEGIKEVEGEVIRGLPLLQGYEIRLDSGDITQISIKYGKIEEI